MAITLVTTIARYEGLSTDEKFYSDDTLKGSTLWLTDTQEMFTWNGRDWVDEENVNAGVEKRLDEVLSFLESMDSTLKATHLGHEAHLWEAEVEIGDL